MEENVPIGSVCCFCNTSDKDEALYGKFYKYQDIITHYFCLLLASKILQRGSDEEGILGFLPKDIANELKRAKTLKCIYCGKTGATIRCYSSKCKVHFHLPCGRKRDTFHQFFGEFKSYCHKHRLKQKVSAQVLKAMRGKESVNCIICLEPVSATPAPNTLWAPCCSKEAWFHRLCVQRLALSAGYFFKCPLCNNTKQFVEAMRTYGIWVPEQDASWEAEPERYSSLLERHNSCDAKSCRCRQGRTFHLENTKWEIILCRDCGSQGIHVQCGNLSVNDDWACPICSSVTVQKENFVKANQASERQQRQRTAANRSRRSRRTSHVRRMTRQSRLPLEADNEDEDVDVVGNGDEDGGGENNEQQESIAAVTSPDVPSPSSAPTPLQKLPPANTPYEKKKLLEPHSRPRMNRKHTQSEQQNPSHTEQPSEDTPTRNTSVEKKCSYEIIDVDDNSDDEVQILYTPNIKFIKTNEGLSVPVVKVPATSTPSGDGVIACGEPCQSSLSVIPTIDLEGDCELGLTKDECLPPTSKSVDPSLNSPVQILKSGDSSQSDDDIEIMEEVHTPNLKIPIWKQTQLPLYWTQTKRLITDASQDTGSCGHLLKANDGQKLRNPGIDSKSANHTIVDSSSSPKCVSENIGSETHSNVSYQTSQQSLKPSVICSASTNWNTQAGRCSVIQKAQSSVDGVRTQSVGVEVPSASTITWQNIVSDLPKQWIKDSSHFVLKPDQGDLPPLISNSQVMVTSGVPLRSSLLPPGTCAVISSSIPTTLTMSTQDKVTCVPSQPVSKSSPINFAHPVTSPVHNARFAVTINENVNESLISASPLLHSETQSNVLFDPSSHGQAYVKLPRQVGHDDWSYSVQVVPGSESTTGNVQAFNANDHPEVIMERNPGPVPLKSLLWSPKNGFSGSNSQAGLSKEGDNTDATSNDDKCLLANALREQKQKLFERPDNNQCFSASDPHSVTDHCQKMYPVAGNENLLPATVMVSIPSNIMPQVATGRDTANNIYIMEVSNFMFPNKQIIQACPVSCFGKGGRKSRRDQFLESKSCTDRKDNEEKRTLRRNLCGNSRNHSPSTEKRWWSPPHQPTVSRSTLWARRQSGSGTSNKMSAAISLSGKNRETIAANAAYSSPDRLERKSLTKRRGSHQSINTRSPPMTRSQKRNCSESDMLTVASKSSTQVKTCAKNTVDVDHMTSEKSRSNVPLIKRRRRGSSNQSSVISSPMRTRSSSRTSQVQPKVVGCSASDKARSSLPPTKRKQWSQSNQLTVTRSPVMTRSRSCTRTSSESRSNSCRSCDNMRSSPPPTKRRRHSHSDQISVAMSPVRIRSPSSCQKLAVVPKSSAEIKSGSEREKNKEAWAGVGCSAWDGSKSSLLLNKTRAQSHSNQAPKTRSPVRTRSRSGSCSSRCTLTVSPKSSGETEGKSKRGRKKKAFGVSESNLAPIKRKQNSSSNTSAITNSTRTQSQSPRASRSRSKSMLLSAGAKSTESGSINEEEKYKTDSDSSFELPEVNEEETNNEVLMIIDCSKVQEGCLPNIHLNEDPGDFSSEISSNDEIDVELNVAAEKLMSSVSYVLQVPVPAINSRCPSLFSWSDSQVSSSDSSCSQVCKNQVSSSKSHGQSVITRSSTPSSSLSVDADSTTNPIASYSSAGNVEFTNHSISPSYCPSVSATPSFQSCSSISSYSSFRMEQDLSNLFVNSSLATCPLQISSDPSTSNKQPLETEPLVVTIDSSSSSPEPCPSVLDVGLNCSPTTTEDVKHVTESNCVKLHQDTMPVITKVQENYSSEFMLSDRSSAVDLTELESVPASRLRNRSVSSITQPSTSYQFRSRTSSSKSDSKVELVGHKLTDSLDPIEKECRIKALALTARKFVPVSNVASLQRKMVTLLQTLGDDHN